jgi:hypothetical protein
MSAPTLVSLQGDVEHIKATLNAVNQKILLIEASEELV